MVQVKAMAAIDRELEKRGQLRLVEKQPRVPLNHPMINPVAPLSTAVGGSSGASKPSSKKPTAGDTTNSAPSSDPPSQPVYGAPQVRNKVGPPTAPKLAHPNFTHPKGVSFVNTAQSSRSASDPFAVDNPVSVIPAKRHSGGDAGPSKLKPPVCAICLQKHATISCPRNRPK